MSSTPKQYPRLLMQFQRQEKVPKLISKYDPFSPQKAFKMPIHQTNEAQIHLNMQRQVKTLMKSIQSQRDQNEQLRSIIKQLRAKSDRLQEINEDLITRLKQLQNTYTDSLGMKQYDKKEQGKKLKRQLYKSVEQYLKTVVDNFTESLKKEKMNQKVEQKIQAFMEELIQINPFTIQNYQRKNHFTSAENIPSNEEANQSIKRMIESRSRSRSNNQRDSFYQEKQSLSKYPQRKVGPLKLQYQTILSNLTAQDRFLQRQYHSPVHTPYHQINASPSNSRRIYRNAGVYSTTPNKRRKIFQDKNY